MGSLPAKGSALTVYRVALADGSRDTFTGATVLDTPYSTDRTPPAGAINPVTGIYYYALATDTYAWDFYAFDTNTNTSIGYVGRLTTPTALFVLTIRNLGLVGFVAATAVAAWRSSVATGARGAKAARAMSPTPWP